MLNIDEISHFEPPKVLIDRFCKEQGIDKLEANDQFDQTKKFLALCARNRSAGLVPSKKIDAMWHAFLLNTRDYFRFCDLVGGYIHHQPSESSKPEGYTETVKLFRETFGELDARFWTEKFPEGADCSGGSCDCCP
jgi:hypothetical protein